MADPATSSRHDSPRLAGCERAECLAAFAEEPDDGFGYGEGGYDWQHCEVEGCHEWYWRGKNGEDCAGCGTKGCEGCAHGTGRHEDDEWLCPGCAARPRCPRCGGRVTGCLWSPRGADEAPELVRLCRNPMCRRARGPVP